MQAIVATADGPSWTERRDVPPPEPEPNEAVVAVRAFAVNRGELRLVKMRDGWQPGQDVAGEVVRPAADGSGPGAGERVHRLAPVPDGVDLAVAAALPMAGTTAANLVREGGALLGSRVLITGASGGVGHLTVQLAALGGAEVVAVARPDRAEAVRAYGAAAVVGDPVEADGLFELVLESAGGASLEAALDR